jgi:hypothetical protein
MSIDDKLYKKSLIYSIQFNVIMGIGDWGLGIGDWAQSPIPNPQSPIPIKFYFILFEKFL